jgi:hypothetical protein
MSLKQSRPRKGSPWLDLALTPPSPGRRRGIVGGHSGIDSAMGLALIAIITLLVSLLTPQLSSPMSRSHRLQCRRVRETQTTRMRAHHGTVGR